MSSEWSWIEKEINIELVSGIVFEIQKWGGGAEGLRRKISAGESYSTWPPRVTNPLGPGQAKSK
jgi:hypothetical protein